MYKKVTSQMEKDIINRYLSGSSTTTIGKEYRLAPSTIFYCLKRNNINTNKTQGDYTKFELLPGIFNGLTEEGNYWVGFIMADGCIVKRSEDHYQFSVKLAKRDEEHLIKLQKYMGSEHKITDTFYYDKRTDKAYPGVGLCISNKELAMSLARYGILPRKSLTAKVSLLEEDRDFWRGVVDGDGSLGVYTIKQNDRHYLIPRITMCGSLELLEQWVQYIKKICQTEANIRKVGEIYYHAVNGFESIKVINHLYDNTSTYLARKRATVLQIKKIFENTDSTLSIVKESDLGLTPVLESN